jgi:hypothetical protein
VALRTLAQLLYVFFLPHPSSLPPRNAVGDLLSAPGDDWIKQGESHGKNGDFTIYYKVQEGARLTCRIESPIPTSHLVPLLSVLNESELYEEWIPTFHRPFKMGVTSSKQLATFSRGHQVIQGRNAVADDMRQRWFLE